MSLLRLPLVGAVGLLLALPQPAIAGGWWSSIHLDRSIVTPGQRMHLHAVVDVRSPAAADEARQPGRFHVYLLGGFDDSALHEAMREPSPREWWWSLGRAEAIRVGEVAVSLPEAGLGRARAAFTVPELPPAPYHVMVCDLGCAEPLADLVPAGFTVAADPATARTARRVDRLARQVRNQAGRLADARAAADSARVTARAVGSDVARLERQLSSAANEDRRSRPAPGAYAGWLVAAALAAALALLVLFRRRSRLPRSVRLDGWQPSDEELRDLLDSETTRTR